MSRVRIAITGFGNMGSAHGTILSSGRVKDAKITAVCDINPERLDFARKMLGDDVKYYSDFDEMIAAGGFDAVTVATPHYFHPPMIIKALNAGYHALSEKPAGVYTRQIREMNEVAEKSDKVFGMMFNQRTNPLYQKMREMVKNGDIGELRRINWIITDWYRPQAYYNSGGWRATWEGEGGGVLTNQDPHQLDLWQWICGMPKRIRANCYFGKFHNMETEDDVTAFMEYENGATGVFVTSTGDMPGANRFEITGTKGKLLVENAKLKFFKLEMSEPEFSKINKEPFAGPKYEVIDVKIEGDNPQHEGIFVDWVNAITNKTPLMAPGTEGIFGVQLSNAMLLSSWTDDWVEIPVDEQIYIDKLDEKIKNSTFKKVVEENFADTSDTY